uniref:Uncharacterized protein n=1 Tax=Nelumbo nucifera TaxID=4432 RepID=A0A822YWJ1_NELNU|nr:TPA_asm: hypothetical protein HUJ06_006145 [Nelumbo nucifera]
MEQGETAVCLRCTSRRFWRRSPSRSISCSEGSLNGTMVIHEPTFSIGQHQ